MTMHIFEVNGIFEVRAGGQVLGYFMTKAEAQAFIAAPPKQA